MGLKADILNQPVSHLPLRPVIALAPDSPVRKAMEAMRKARLGCVVIVDDQQRPLGKFTERQLMKLLAQGADCLEQPVQNYMFGQEDCVPLTEPIINLTSTMERCGLRYMIVVDREGRATALTGQKGVMEYIAEHFPRQVKVQQMTAKLHMDQREGA